VERRPDAQPLLRYATVTDAPLYRAIVEVFATAAAGYTGRLSPADVHHLLLDGGQLDPDDDPPTVEEVAARLNQLRLWGNLSADHDTSRATSLDGYGRTAFVYDLTPGGEAAAEALATLEEGLRRVGGLQAVALRQIEEKLAELVAALSTERPDGDQVYGLCEDLHGRFKSLTTNAAAFMQKVHKLLSSPVLDTAEFTLFKADTITYLNDFIGDLDTLSAHIRRRLSELDRIDPARRAAALRAAQESSGQLTLDGPAAGAATWTSLTEAHLAGLAEWFRAAPEARTGAAVLYQKARDAILGIARVAERIRESATSPSGRSADLLALAVAFEAADDDGAHLLWHAAFGLAGSRHLGAVNPADSVPATTSWWDADSAVELNRQLRATGRTDYVRRAMHVPDRSADKRRLAENAREQRAEAARAAHILVALGPVPLSQVADVHGGPLTHDALRLLAELLSRAVRGHRGRDGRRAATSVDGSLHITLTDPQPPAAAQLNATTGVWTVPDYHVEVRRSADVRAAQRAAADRSATSRTDPTREDVLQ
jgi:uncharacterized protein (TIGR02677 family)